MKKIILPISIVLLFIILGISVYFIFFNKSAEQVSNQDNVPTPTIAATPTAAPTATPTTVPVKEQVLYPAYKVVGGITKYGYIDSTGAFVIEPVYDFADDFHEGLAVVRQGEDNMVIDQKGAVIYQSKNTIGSFHNGAASICTTQDTWLYGFIDTTGKVIVEPKYSSVSNFNKDGQAYVSLSGSSSYALIDITGNVIDNYTPNVDSDYFISFEDGYGVYTKNARFGVVSIVTGEPILEPKYSDIVYLGNGLFAVKDPSLENYEAEAAPAAIFNNKGEQLTDYVYYEISHFNGEYASACDDTTIFFIGTDGKQVSSLPSYDGSGVLSLMGDVIKANVDGVLTYYHTDNTVLWKADTTLNLGSGITVKDMIFKPLRTVLVHYPQIEGLSDANVQSQINEQLETTFVEPRANITKEDGMNVSDSFVATLKYNLITISMSGYDYSNGAAHGMPIQNNYFIDTTTGQFYELKDLFKQGSDYKTPINEFIKKKIKESIATGESMFFEDEFKGIDDAQYFYLTDDGVTIYFYPYDIAAYAGGFPEFAMTFDQLSDVIDKDGAFWKAFHDPSK